MKNTFMHKHTKSKNNGPMNNNDLWSIVLLYGWYLQPQNLIVQRPQTCIVTHLWRAHDYLWIILYNDKIHIVTINLECQRSPLYKHTHTHTQNIMFSPGSCREWNKSIWIPSIIVFISESLWSVFLKKQNNYLKQIKSAIWWNTVSPNF